MTNPRKGLTTPVPIRQSVFPMIAYENGLATMEWLALAFGFRELTRLVGQGGRLAHGEMQAGDGIIMLATPSPYYEGPKKHRDGCDRAKRWSEVPWVIDGVLVHVRNVDDHFRRAKQAGALILSEPETGTNGRSYRVEDIEGHRWMFLQPRTR